MPVRVRPSQHLKKNKGLESLSIELNSAEVNMHYLVYKITNKVNNKIYVGTHETNNIEDDYFGSGTVLKRAINKYGLDNFTKEILFDFQSEKEMYEMEKEIVDEEFIARMDTYNIVVGGNGGFNYVNKNGLNIYDGHSDQSKINIRKAIERVKVLKKDKEWMDIVKIKVSNGLKLRYMAYPHYWIGKKHTEETKKKIGEKNRIKLSGENNPHFGKVWVYNLNLKESIRIEKNKLENYLKDGWIKGRKMNFV